MLNTNLKHLETEKDIEEALAQNEKVIFKIKLKLKTLTKTIENTDAIKGVTLEERARMVLWTLGRTTDEICKAYRRLAKRHHPDTAGGDSIKFKVINEAYQLLAKGQISKRPLLADDQLILKITGRRAAPLIDKQKEWEEHERWHRNKFYGVGVV